MAQEDYKVIEFPKVGGLELGVEALLKTLTKDYNIFIHNIQDGKMEDRDKMDINDRMLSIQRNGFNIDYSCLLDTMKYLRKPTAREIIEYVYGWAKKQDRINAIIAIPKNVKINGFDIDFSTPITDVATLDTLYEVVKGSKLDNEFMAFFIHPEPTDGKPFLLEINEKHLSKLTKEEQESFMNNYANKCKEACGITDTDNKTFINYKKNNTIEIKAKSSQKFTEGSYYNDFDWD